MSFKILPSKFVRNDTLSDGPAVVWGYARCSHYADQTPSVASQGSCRDLAKSTVKMVKLIAILLALSTMTLMRSTRVIKPPVLLICKRIRQSSPDGVCHWTFSDTGEVAQRRNLQIFQYRNSREVKYLFYYTTTTLL